MHLDHVGTLRTEKMRTSQLYHSKLEIGSYKFP